MTTSNQIEIPGNPHILNWTAQDTIGRIMEMEEGDREGVTEIQEYLTQATPEERASIGEQITQKNHGDRRLIEVLVDGNVEDAFQYLLQRAQG